MQGKRIVLCASRKLEEMTALIEKQGGIAIVRPAQGTVFAKDEALIDEIRDVIFQKRIGLFSQLVSGWKR